MTRYVLRAGRLVEVVRRPRVDDPDRFPTPRVSRFEGYQSPIDDSWISSDRQRERDLAANEAYDPRDLTGHTYTRGREAQLREISDGAGTGPEAGNIWGKWDNDTVRGGAEEEPS